MKTRRFGKAPRKRILLINPATGDNMWTMGGTARLFGHKALMPCAALATLVALTPEDADVEYVLCDENVGPIRWNLRCDLVAVTGYSIQGNRIAEICRRFRDRGIPVALGGMHATVEPENAHQIADHVFIGEGEYTWPKFLRDWLAGKAEAEYRQAELVDMADSPPPDWSLIRPHDYLYFTVQTTRGCPFRCEFCEVVKVFGRSFRHKPVDQILAEVRTARALTEEGVFFSDDNFVVKRGYTKELLERLVEYNRSLPKPMSFATQATIGIAEDEEVLQLMADAGFEIVFLGVESPRRACLEEVGKHHTAHLDPVASVNRISGVGIAPIVGLICGFDHDDPATFAEMRELLDSTATPLASISLMNAAVGTPLYRRLLEEGRIVEQFDGDWFFGTNIRPRGMTLKQLVEGHRDLLRGIYSPAAFHDRLRRWLRRIQYVKPVYPDQRVTWSGLKKLAAILIGYCLRAPREQRQAFLAGLRDTARRNPRLIRPYILLTSQYWHFFRFVEKAKWQTVVDEATRAPAKLPEPSEPKAMAG